MADKRIEITIPEALYSQLEEVASASGWSLEAVIQQTLRAGMPPTLSKVSADFHEELIVLNKLSDKALLQIAEESWAEASESPQRKAANFNDLRRVYALLLLRWRGHPVPAPHEL